MNQIAFRTRNIWPMGGLQKARSVDLIGIRVAESGFLHGTLRIAWWDRFGFRAWGILDIRCCEQMVTALVLERRS